MTCVRGGTPSFLMRGDLWFQLSALYSSVRGQGRQPSVGPSSLALRPLRQPLGCVRGGTPSFFKHVTYGLSSHSPVLICAGQRRQSSVGPPSAALAVIGTPAPPLILSASQPRASEA